MTNDERRSRGIAVPLVLGAITILSALATDFAYNSSIQLQLAANARDRLQAEYLANSAVQFLRLELKLEKTAKNLFSQLPAGAKGTGSGPLCKQYPLSTALLKAIFMPSEGEGGEAPPPEAAKARMVTAFDTEAAEEFLGFRGDFAGECEDEGGKLNLNVFADLDPTQQVLSGMNMYDRQKEMLAAFLAQERFKELLGTTNLPKEIARNIADWVDTNDQVNEKGGAQGGSESASYSGDGREYKVKNGKMLTLDEAYLVAGVTDRWFTPLKEHLTVYGESKVNLCAATPEVVEAVVTAYAVGNPKFPTFSATNVELMKKVQSAVTMACEVAQPQASKVAQDVEVVLAGGTPTTGTPATLTPATPPPPAGTTAATGSSLADLIVTEPRFFRLLGTGEVGKVAVRITTVIDTKESDPKKWKVLYWRLD